MQANEPIPAPPGPGGKRNVSTILSVVAVVLAAAALGAAVAIPGPAGPGGPRGAAGANGTNGTNGAVGPQGPQGPAGAGTLMASFHQYGSTTIGSGCTNSTGSASLAVPSKGNVTITASVTVQMSHTSGTLDAVYLYASTSRFGGCSDTAGYAVVPSNAATAIYYVDVTVVVVSPVASAGTYTYTVGAATAGTAYYYFVSGYAVFYPG